jgi:phage pi2 protein 07
MENKTIETYTDKNGNKWESKIMKNFAGEKYKVLYKNGKKAEILERIDEND